MMRCALEDLTEAEQRLVREALAARERAHAPYTGFKVGAAVSDEAGNVHSGCNVESADLTLTTHAEIDAINRMIAKGGRRVTCLAVAVQARAGWAMPCGLCRQRLREFAASPDARVLGVNLDRDGQIREIWVSTLAELLPYSFGPEHL